MVKPQLGAMGLSEGGGEVIRSECLRQGKSPSEAVLVLGFLGGSREPGLQLVGLEGAPVTEY